MSVFLLGILPSFAKCRINAVVVQLRLPPLLRLSARNTGVLLRLPSAGLTWEECKQRCPPNVVPACHNSEDTVTVSGPLVSKELMWCIPVL